MKAGLALGAAGSVPADARRAEALGFDYLACGEHLFFQVAPNPFVELAAAAAVTTRIRLVSTVSLLPLYPAALAAKLAATLDQVAQGRFELGVGAGGEAPAEFEAVGVDPAERFRRLDEGLEVLRLLFRGGPVSYEGTYTRLRDVALDPPPVQPGGPPIWLGGRKDGAIRRAGRFASTWLPYMVTPEQLRAGLDGVRAAAAGHGRDPSSVGAALFAFACADPDAGRARRAGIDYVSAAYRQDFAPLADRYLLLGSPGAVARRIREFAAAGADTVILQVAAAPEDRDRVLDTIAHDVLPELR
ncbi:LLM class flavin-dependent oxidoreductase [Dactylosporangium sucinum]|uniref:N5,N10-methylene tetrahydromethanopterin reductase n=1 Tax=Dactylosporangium sucinum TaxID=1424081 RepID=A0A917UDT5_9ACTN|nr:LLM class flavin-dependent oxidoreductase [Dactylosporangium sucinum]GGM75384.1 N5,N10-methylene tetrahydromethanopterin reductase [Dactylosporangium sucinum]